MQVAVAWQRTCRLPSLALGVPAAGAAAASNYWLLLLQPEDELARSDVRVVLRAAGRLLGWPARRWPCGRAE